MWLTYGWLLAGSLSGMRVGSPAYSTCGLFMDAWASLWHGGWVPECGTQESSAWQIHDTPLQAT